MERLTSWERLRRVNPYAWDSVLAGSVFGLSFLLELLFLSSGQNLHVAPWTRVLTAATCAPLVWRRRAPITILALTAIGTVALELRGYPIDFIGLALVIAMYTAAAHRDRALVLTLALPISLAAALTIYLSPPDDQPVIGWAEVLVDTAFFVGLPMAFGRYEFNRRRRSTFDRERAARDAVTDERARIARELHDIVAHAMGVMVVQAGAARVVLEQDPSEAAAAMKRIEETGRSGLAEMRRLVGILESEKEEAALVPQPGTDRLDELLETMRAAGLPVEAMVEGTPRDLPPGVDLTAFRVVQEALTNALSHAGKAHARVLLRFRDEALELEISDDGRGPLPDGAQGAGHGLIGMRERVALFGGSLETGARPGGGFVVRATIPTAETT